MPNPHGSFIWYELITPDPDGAKRFYDAVVGWNVDAQSSFPNGYRMIGRSDGKSAGGIMPLSDDMKSHGARPVWLGYIGVGDVDRAVADVEGTGGKTLLPAFDIPNVGRVAMVADGQGAPFYVMTPTPPPGQPDAASDVFSVDQAQHVRWNELSTTDPASAIAFYARHFGWRQEGEMDMAELGKYQFLQHDGVMIGAVMPKMPQMPVSLWTFYIGVDDIDRAHEAVRSGAGQVFQDPMEIPGGEYSLNGMDPQGATFGLVGPRNR
jgi:predicted enzyme related to lactoylglutathione lyase